LTSRHAEPRSAPLRPVPLILIGVLLSLLATACSHGSPPKSAVTSTSTSTVARPLNADEADRLAVTRFNTYRAKMLSVTGTIISGVTSTNLTLRGWISTAKGEGYGLAQPSQGTGFLTIWDATQVSAQDYAGTSPPLPRPQTGWSTADLKASDSAMAAGQLVLLGLSSDVPDNPQLLIQDGAEWLGAGKVDGVPVDIMSGPLSTGATVSNLRYWVDSSGQLRRLQARLDGRDWSTFDLAIASNVTF
jgi:hypothetical protein